LGPLRFDDEQEVRIDDVNAAPLAREPRESLAGPPLVTCKAWAIADARTGELLWSHKPAEKRDIASTTKMMTAYVVCELAKADPKLLDELVTFSESADKTSGTTADVRAGEKLPVRELLYGLLLPSGNDAATALAEHLGPRLAAVGGAATGSAPANASRPFIDEMNRRAAALGMADTHYENPHGLTAPGHQSTAQDLVKLAKAAMQNDVFRQYVGTRQHAAKVTGPGGYERTIVWRNTNRLLGIEGYLGIKTGTTGAAGACLVSWGERDGRELVVVVLGSTSSDARYVDSRNLYRWAWSQLAK